MPRITLKDLRAYDADHADEFSCVVRLIEMMVDAALQNARIEQGYGIQFWRDVELYGLNEAFVYLEQTVPAVYLGEVEQKIKETIELVDTWKRPRTVNLAFNPPKPVALITATLQGGKFSVDARDANGEVLDLVVHPLKDL